jgi:hypothetical protein
MKNSFFAFFMSCQYDYTSKSEMRIAKKLFSTYILIHPDESISVNKFLNPTHDDSNYKTLLLKSENF